MGWVDIVFIGLIVIFAIIGLSKGLFESILGIFSTVLAVAIAIWVSGPVSSFINSTVHANEFFGNLLVNLGWISETGIEIGKIVYSKAQIGNALSVVVSVVAVWLLIKLAIALLSKLFDEATSSNSALSGLNRVLGLIFGAAKGFIIGVVILGLASLLSMCGLSNVKTTIESKSKFTNFVYGYVNEWVRDAVEDKLESILKDVAGDGEDGEQGGEAVTVTFADGNQVEITL